MSKANLPQNNLQHVLLRKALNSQNSSIQAMSPVTGAEGKKSKFKPAAAMSSYSYMKAEFTATKATLVAFDTVGCKETNVAAAAQDINEVDTDSSGRNPLYPRKTTMKRLSSESFVDCNSSPQSPKRLKKDDNANKENIFLVNYNDKGDRSDASQCPTGCLEYQDDKNFWTTFPQHPDTDSFAEVNKESFQIGFDQPDSHNSDLSGLHKILLHNEELQSSVANAILKFNSAPTDSIDIVILERIRNVLLNRIRAVKSMLDSHCEPPDSRNGESAIRNSLSNLYEASLSDTVRSETDTSTGIIGGSRSLSLNVKSGEEMNNSTLTEVSGPIDIDFQRNPHYQEVMCKLKEVFKLSSFRENQLEAIIRTLEGRDVLILMPTGGGKSLCYQLPAVCAGGQTHGVTVVISPLLALMNDQVNSLKQKGISVVLWSSETTNDVAKQLLCSNLSKPRLLYITPEKLRNSGSAQSVLMNLYRADRLARFVIDEAHVISTWGQDFRDAYQDLISLRANFPKVPIMALTATANRVTIDDINKRLQLQNCVLLKASFNRRNLKYTITSKRPSAIVADIIKFIKKDHSNESGIVYCLGRDTCERVAAKLREGGLVARHYHARMVREEKDTALHEWKSGRCKIIVATIAFGMGIDKADVRFVIHYDLPKSLDGYYQETGRAGRDGKPADCLLYYSFSDFHALKRMIERTQDGQRASQNTIDRQLSEVRKVVTFCTNLSDCRRVQLLQHFDEKFNKVHCASMCDNCNYDGPVERKDMTAIATSTVELVRELRQTNENVTIDVCKWILAGSRACAILNRGFDQLPLYGSCGDLPRELLELMLQRILALDVLMHFTVQHNNGFHTSYIELGPGAKELIAGKLSIMIDWRPRVLRSQGRRRLEKETRRVTNSADSRWPKEASKHTQVIDAIGTLQVRSPSASSDEEIEDAIDIPVKFNVVSDPTSIYRELCELRTTLAITLSLNEDDILDDEILQMLSVACPKDNIQFREIMKTALLDRFINETEVMKIIDSKSGKYGSEFLQAIKNARV
ncbi:hypothetical protein AX17_003415 [Amanita inopinata Kibby_2008]|nr:hypothetical protein AX17_003415 [Amanita inopinata Kibby_2008]